MWSKAEGYATEDFLRRVHPRLANFVAEKMPGRLLAPGEVAGPLCETMAQKLGLPPGVPVSAAIIDAHAGVPGAGAAEPSTLVMVLGTSSCHMLNATEDRFVPGVAGVVEDGILPGYFGYETGQAAVGDAFDWLRRVLGHRGFAALTEKAAQLPAGAEGVMCVDWFNGCRTPLMDGALTGTFTGLTLQRGPAHLYRALLEASAFGVRWIVELLRENGVPVKKFIATGGLPHSNPFLVQIYADVLAEPIVVHPSKQGPALGAAILGVLAAGRAASGFSSPAAAIRAMAAPRAGVPGRQPLRVGPRRGNRNAYDAAYDRYRSLADALRAFRPLR
jgi:L-ribulokinase